MGKKSFVINLAICYCCLSGCVHDTSSKQIDQPTNKADQNDTGDYQQPVKIFTTGNNIFISFDTIKFQIPSDLNITSANLHNDIYEFKSDSLIRHKTFVAGNLALLTTFEDLGQGIRSQLYAFD